MPVSAAVFQVTEGQEFSSLPAFEEAAIRVCVCVCALSMTFILLQWPWQQRRLPNFPFFPNPALVSHHPLGKSGWI